MRNSAFKKRLLEELPELVASGVLDEEAARKLRLHYGDVPGGGARLLLLTFSVLGALLIGGGVILLIAHNWDDLPRWSRAVLAYLPLLAAQGMAVSVLGSPERSQSQPWREGVGTGWHLALPCAIALISQTYNLGGTLQDFTFAWMLLSLPIAYLMDSVFAGALSLLVLGVWRFFQLEGQADPWYWFYLALLSPLAVREFMRDSRSGRSALLCWFAVFAVFAGVLPVILDGGRWLPLFIALAGGAFYLAGRVWFGEEGAYWRNPFRGVGGEAVCILLLVLSYSDVWSHLVTGRGGRLSHGRDFTVELYVLMAFFGAGWLRAALRALKSGDYVAFSLGAAPLAVGCATALALWTSPLAASISVNLYGLGAGIALIVHGARAGQLSTVNRGMGLVSLLAFMRFVDASQEIIPRAIALMVIGAAFLLVNRKLAANLRETRHG